MILLVISTIVLFSAAFGSLWTDYHAVFPNHLENIFTEELVLENAHLYAIANETLKDSLHYACSKYLDGAKFGKVIDIVSWFMT
jgi:hypothetical protein